MGGGKQGGGGGRVKGGGVVLLFSEFWPMRTGTRTGWTLTAELTCKRRDQKPWKLPHRENSEALWASIGTQKRSSGSFFK